ncbi:MAG: DNA topoisomerase [Thaumarchaeota archaeon 13_1_40CM_38_12]|nr:MAG: DNA topoisomerase [Thaumarchaeota archaeon 13_1_40CM_38_12]OLC33981.1 MAG: DNA topoisomerase [Thaumarchaeota archaeon 13_1_40CM_4_38_7]OLC93624.1 MAG: DNA topoisomerase [Thaumarchaeota archaeon 13_1_40CM_3_38_6]OLD28196.1 MAG: DNA topoisomerase [Thaumarchaeota archaeon 13_1_40CM_2_39_7]TLY03276.1 MAG: DNA topoisomerase VI subunit B [Nitrososphaerota archaeon]
MSSNKETFSQISPSEFFYRNRDLAGFSNPTRSLYTSVREFVENALDACDQKRILPDIHLSIKAVDSEQPDPKHYVLTVKDNGPGIDPKHIPLAFGTVLYGSKFGLKQARGMFGLGATMAILYGQITTNKPVTVKSCADEKTLDEFVMLLDIQKNKPVILKHTTKEAAKTGLSVSIVLEGDYSKAGTKIRDYVSQTSLITPYASITFEDPAGEKFHYPRIVKEMPPPPTVIKPHPHGVDVETLRRMIIDTHYQIPTVDNKMIEKVRKELGMQKKNPSPKDILDRAEKRWSDLSRSIRIVIAVMSFLNIDFEMLRKIRIDDVDIANKKVVYWDFGESQSHAVELDPESTYYKQLANTVQGETLLTFLTKRFQRVGPTTSEKFCEFAKLKPEKRIGSMTNDELVRLADALQKFDEFLAPDPSCLAPLGEEPLSKGVMKFFNPEFAAVIQRSASAYSGFPFIVEMGIAYGGDIPQTGLKVYRFANRIPLLYDEGSDVVLKVVNETDWSRYKVKGEPPLVIVSHICSTRIPYKTVGKENVADRPELERELKNALQYLARKLAVHMSRQGMADMAKKRANLYTKYVPLIAQFATELSGKKKEPNYKQLVRMGSEIEEQI